MEKRRLQGLPVVSVPKPDGVIGPDGYCYVAAGAKGHRDDSTRVLQWWTYRFPRPGIPDPCGFVQSSGSRKDSPAVWAQDCRPDRAVVLQWLTDRLSCFRIPQASGPIPAGGQNSSAIRRKTDGGYPGAMFQIRIQFYSFGDVPKFTVSLLAAAEYPPAIRTQNRTRHFLRLRERPADGLSRDCSPKLSGKV